MHEDIATHKCTSRAGHTRLLLKLYARRSSVLLQPTGAHSQQSCACLSWKSCAHVKKCTVQTQVMVHPQEQLYSSGKAHRCTATETITDVLVNSMHENVTAVA